MPMLWSAAITPGASTLMGSDIARAAVRRAPTASSTTVPPPASMRRIRSAAFLCSLSIYQWVLATLKIEAPVKELGFLAMSRTV